MKFTASILFLLFCASSFSRGILPDKSRLRLSYQIVSDEAKSDVPDNQVRIKGTVHSEENVKNGIVSTLDRERLGRTDQEGNYEFLLRPTDTSIFFYKPQLDEIVIWSYNFQAGHEVVIDFYPESDMKVLEVDKPVIYVYSEEPITLTLKPEFKGDIDFTYPALNESWNIKTNIDGSIVDLNTGQNYPYLFWEGQTSDLSYNTNSQERKGFLIKTDSTIEFLERTLSSLSLSSREQADFITFWGPQLQQKEYAFVEFLIDEDYEAAVSTNHCSIQPDVSRRVFMLYTGLESDLNLGFDFTNQSFSSIKREGLVLIEWGGSEIPLIKLNSL